MKDLLKKSILTGIGLISISRDRCEAMAREWVKKGKLSEKEGRELVDNLLKEASEHKSDLKDLVEGLIDDASDRLHWARQSELESLREEVTSLKNELSGIKDELSELRGDKAGS